MTKPPDLETLARKYVELWQDQVATTAADPEVTEGLARMLHMMSGGLAASTALWQGFWPDPAAYHATDRSEPRDRPDSRAGNERAGTAEGQDFNGTSQGQPAQAPTPPGPTPIAGVSFGGRHDVAQLQARIAILEERIAQLESRAVKPRRRSKKRLRIHSAS